VIAEAQFRPLADRTWRRDLQANPLALRVLARDRTRHSPVRVSRQVLLADVELAGPVLCFRASVEGGEEDDTIGERLLLRRQFRIVAEEDDVIEKEGVLLAAAGLPDEYLEVVHAFAVGKGLIAAVVTASVAREVERQLGPLALGQPGDANVIVVLRASG